MESPDVDIASMSKSSAPWQGNAVRVASRQSRALEDEVMLVTGALRGREEIRYRAPGRAQR